MPRHFLCLLLLAPAIIAFTATQAQGYSEEYEYSFEGVFVDEYLEIFDYSGDYEYDDGENVSAPVLNVPEQAAPANELSCGDGDGFEWVVMDPDMASQWGDLDSFGAYTGASMAFGSNCSNLYEAGTNETSGCCSATSEGAFPWWQYDLGKKMMVKGVRLSPAIDDALCCQDSDCSDLKECSILRNENLLISVGGFSLPEYYSTPEYEKLLASAGGDASQVQPAVISALQEGSTFCNVVTEFDFLKESESLSEFAGIRCTGAEGAIKGQFVSLHLPTTEDKSLALCSFEVCAKAIES